ncbi:MAG: glycosyltransferase [Candidatus Peregrinibacteria bacterium]|nr:glycosyltransferase [Candidatus Peregrinibacteria bacterium]
MRIAIVADWLPVFAGAEHSIAEWTAVWPQAPIFTTVARKRNIGPLGQKDIHTSRLQKWFRLLRRHEVLLPAMPRAVEDIDLRGFDVILSSSHAVGKGIIPPANAVHVCYCHTPMRYAWEMEDPYLDDFRVPQFLRPLIRRQLKKLRRWDLSTAKRVDVFLSNSTETQERIMRTYARESTVIPPPVSDRFLAEAIVPMEEREAYLAVGRLVPYKRFDLLIQLSNETHLPLTIIGTGQEEKRLREMAGPQVHFQGFVPDEALPKFYASAKALLFPQHEDAGIVPLEAQACGTPVIAYQRGGVRDTVKEGETGIFFAEQTVASLEEAIKRFDTLSFDPTAIREHAQTFSSASFRQRMQEEVERAYERFCIRNEAE